MNRRDFLRAAGVAIALPAFRSLGAPAASAKHRLVMMMAPLGLHPAYFWPEGTGTDWKASEYLELIKEFRSQTTVVQGMVHPGMSPGFAHQASASFLTGAPGAGRPGFKNSISIDQLAAEHIGDQTRFRALVLSGEGAGLSWTRTGALVPADNQASRIFAKLFLADTAEDIQKREQQLAEGRSALDDVSGQAKKLQGALTADDREKLEEYLTSVRELEKRLAKDEQWFRKPKPKVDAKPPQDVSNAADVLGRLKNMLDLTALALQTDSTRLVTVMMAGATQTPPIEGVKLGYHDLSHHGKDASKLGQLKIIEVETMKVLRDFLAKLKASKEDGATLLDRTTVFLGSNLGDGSSHSIKNLPAMVVGGGFKHGRHLQPPEGTPLCNLYLSFLQRLGVPATSFGTSTGPLKGFDLS